MKHLLYMLSTVAVLCACSGVSREWQAATEAQKYYE